MLGRGHDGLHQAQKRKKEGDRLAGESDKIIFIDLRFEIGEVAAFGKGSSDGQYKLQK